jgi:cell wall-associated NlpC family hydrolase
MKSEMMVQPLAATFALTVLVSGCVSEPPAQDAAVRESIIETALGQIGRPYHYGGTDPSGFDCSGLVQYSYSAAGVKIPRTTHGLFNAGKRVSFRDARPGDLLFYRFPDEDGLHVTIYLGEGQMVHAPENGKQVIVVATDAPAWSDHFVTAMRVLP